jgi:hypothetical protein
MGTPAATVIERASNMYVYPSPVTEFCNNGTRACAASGTATTAGTDYIFFSAEDVSLGGCQQGTGNGCVLSYIVSSGAPVYSNYLSYSHNSNCFGTGGIVIDNAIPAGTEAGASQVYFMILNGSTANLCGGTGNGSLSGIQLAQ